MFGRIHYNAISKIVNDVCLQIDGGLPGKDAINELTEQLANYFEQEYEGEYAFNRIKFIDACLGN